jgi:hypothetical protein
MIKGLDRFKAHFAQYPDSYLMIGGVACHEWFQTQGLEFRATKDLDVVIIVEALTQAFVEHFWEFVETGGYEIREKSEGERVLYRFSKPKDDAFPFMIEVFSRQPDSITLWESQTIIPIVIGEDEASLSAILLDDAYYQLVLNHRIAGSDPSAVSPFALIPLKAKAWLDLAQRKAAGNETVDSKDIDKHRTDVFRLTATLTGELGPVIDPRVKADLKQFVAAFPPDAPDWARINDALKATFGNGFPKADALLKALNETFKLEA